MFVVEKTSDGKKWQVRETSTNIIVGTYDSEQEANAAKHMKEVPASKGFT
jgi:hypothetical protein